MGKRVGDIFKTCMNTREPVVLKIDYRHVIFKSMGYDNNVTFITRKICVINKFINTPVQPQSDT